jgi:hypothetical protein
MKKIYILSVQIFAIAFSATNTITQDPAAPDNNTPRSLPIKIHKKKNSNSSQFVGASPSPTHYAHLSTIYLYTNNILAGSLSSPDNSPHNDQ